MISARPVNPVESSILGRAGASALVVALLAALCAFAPVQKGKDKEKKGGSTPAKTAAPAPVLAPWKGKLSDAKVSAKERNVPVLIHLIIEKEQTNDEYRDKVLPDVELLKRSEAALVIVANNGLHERKRIDVVDGGEKTTREVCSVYPMFDTCQQHQAAWQEIYVDFQQDDGVLLGPQAIVLAPDGATSGRINTSNTPAPTEIEALITEAIAKCGPGLSEDQLVVVKKALDDGRRASAQKSWVEAWTAWSTVLGITRKSPYADEARKAEPVALEGMQKELERIAAGLVPGTAAKAYAELAKFGTEVAATPLAKDVAARLKKADADKTLQPELKAWRLSTEADALLREANGFTDVGEAKKAEKVVRKLLAPKFSGTPAQETARKLWPDLAKEIADTPK